MGTVSITLCREERILTTVVGWLTAWIFIATFTAIVMAVRELEREASRGGLRALREAAATFHLVERAPRLTSSSDRVFRGRARGFKIVWRLPVRGRVKRPIELQIRHSAIRGNKLPLSSREGFPPSAKLAVDVGCLSLFVEDVLGNDISELVPCTRRLLIVAAQLAELRAPLAR